MHEDPIQLLPGRIPFAGSPDGAEAFATREIVRRTGASRILFVARDAERRARFENDIAVFLPSAHLISMPAWDCLPYDRSSPNREIISARMKAFGEIGRVSESNLTLISTTVSALLQRIPPAASITSGMEISVGGRFSEDAFQSFVSINGYVRADTVMEPGEFALRGSIVDVFPAGSSTPARIDLFGDEVEGIRSFDPLTQRSEGSLNKLSLVPASEAPLDAKAIERFRSGYGATFGGEAINDPLYVSVSAGRRHPGMEHWLPFFHSEMATLFDLLPKDAVIVLDHAIDEAIRARFETIADHFSARAETLSEIVDEQPYRPLSPPQLYLTPDEWTERLAEWPSLALEQFLRDGSSLSANATPIIDFAEARARSDADLYLAVGARLRQAVANKRIAVLVASSQGALDRLKRLVAQEGDFEAVQAVQTFDEIFKLPQGAAAGVIAEIDRGFETDTLLLVTEADIVGERINRRHRRRRRADTFLTEVSDIVEGDLVVHLEHGIGRYEGLETVTAGGAPHDCLRVIYDAGDRLFVPVENIDVLSRFGSDSDGATLDRLGGAAWQARRAKAKERIREMAAQLIAVAAQRLTKPAEKLVAPEGVYEEFAAKFPFDETEDQLSAISEVFEDMSSGRPMDRLICGDVGFGKTEVALRAALIAAMSGRQVALVAPTTLLARQHFSTFSRRFQGLPVQVRQLSRLVTGKEAAATREGMKDGTVDVVIGTHALLAGSVEIPNLGLLIIDEEQRFGVAHKERLKKLRNDVHVLTLTATPIPRTLQMALAGVREMSVIATPPVDRLAVRTFVGEYDSLQIKEAIQRERFRGGQTFFVAPRIRDLPTLVERVEKLVPDARTVVAHGQLPASQLEDVMSAFYEGRYDVLISTNIVESGLDIPTANTLLVHRADRFGLSQLYQLRGRIGRGKERGYCYLTLPNDQIVTKTALRRLEVMQTLDALGAGFNLASHDLDIRGGGNLLGDEQSGHIREVGVELYQQMLEEAVAAARAQDDAKPFNEAWSPQINLGSAVLIPEAYVRELNTRLGLYRRLGALETEQELQGFAAELVDRFGPLPPEVENLLEVMSVKRLCRLAHVAKLDVGPKGAVASFHNNDFPNPAGLIEYLTQQMGTAKLRPDNKLVVTRAWEDRKVRAKGVKRLLSGLAKVAS